MSKLVGLQNEITSGRVREKRLTVERDEALEKARALREENEALRAERTEN